VHRRRSTPGSGSLRDPARLNGDAKPPVLIKRSSDKLEAPGWRASAELLMLSLALLWQGVGRTAGPSLEGFLFVAQGAASH